MKRFEAWCIKNKHFWIQPPLVIVLFWFILFVPIVFFKPFLTVFVFLFFVFVHFFIIRLIKKPKNWKLRFDRKISYIPKTEIEKFKEDPVVWINKNFTSSQSVVRFVLERAFVDSIPNESFILNLRLIPRSKQLNPESLKKIIPHINWIPLIEVESIKIDQSFVNFDESLIVKIWTSPFEIIEVVSLYEAIKDGIVLEKANSFSKIMSQLQKKEKQNNFPDKIQISNTIKGFLLLTKHSYRVAGYEFSNCVESYFDKKTNVFVFYKLNMPYACVEVNNKGEILEIRGAKNRLLSAFDQSLIRVELSSRILPKL